jgi:hypothetical protein
MKNTLKKNYNFLKQVSPSLLKIEFNKIKKYFNIFSNIIVRQRILFKTHD